MGCDLGVRQGSFPLRGASPILSRAAGELATPGGAGVVHWDNLDAVPTGLADGDDDTTYTAGPGLVLTGTEFAMAGSLATFTPADNATRTIDSGS